MDSSSSTTDFDLRIVAVLFRRSLSPSAGKIDTEEHLLDGCVTTEPTDVENNFGDVLLKEYVEAYNELNKMFPKLGFIFSFVASDVADKARILSEHLTSPSAEKYGSIIDMLDYEKNELNILDPSADGTNNGLPNGSRTLLRLHRALLFVVQFIDAVRQAGEQDNMAHMARKAYDDTLARYHPWLIRKGVHIAVRTLPNRHQLIADLAGSDLPMDEAERVMQDTAAAGRSVYDTVQKLYEDRGLLDLP